MRIPTTNPVSCKRWRSHHMALTWHADCWWLPKSQTIWDNSAIQAMQNMGQFLSSGPIRILVYAASMTWCNTCLWRVDLEGFDPYLRNRALEMI